MRYAIRGFSALAPLTLLFACSSVDGGNDEGALKSAATAMPVQAEVSDDPVMLGAPFTVESVTYTPQDVPAYDEVGYASYHGADLSGRFTANGETFRPTAAAAAHKTLPMPSYVEVTALDTGRTILVRINDRGPLANDRLIGLSEGAARQLGIASDGVIGVRVRRVNPPEQEKAVLRQGITAAERIETPEALLKILRDKLAKQPKPGAGAQKAASVPAKGTAKLAPVVQSAEERFIREEAARTETAKRAPVPVKREIAAERAVKGGYVVQVAALSSRTSADALARKLGASVAKTADGRLFRVRYGPYGSEAEAQRGLAAARAKGYPQARIYRN